MQRDLLNTIANAGDDNLGQTLIRLAHLAAASHRYEVARRVMRGAMSPSDTNRIGGTHPRPVVHVASGHGQDADGDHDAVRTEVNP